MKSVFRLGEETNPLMTDLITTRDYVRGQKRRTALAPDVQAALDDPSAAFVVKAEELAILGRLGRAAPRPQTWEWINRGTNQHLRLTTVEMLLRTIFREGTHSPTVERLHRTSGLRMIFRDAAERRRFAAAFARARLARAGSALPPDPAPAEGEGQVGQRLDHPARAWR